MAVDVNAVLDELDTEDYAAFSQSRDTKPSEPEDEEAPAAGDKKPTSESDDAEEAETGQTAEESETADEEQQKEEGDEESQEEAKKPGKGNRGIDKRFGKLTGKIAALESRLAELGEKPAEGDEEVAEEVASSPEKATGDTTAEKLVRPKLRDFGDTEEISAWDQYEAAIEAYDAKLELKQKQNIATALAEQKAELELAHAKKLAEADWSKAASRFPDFNEVVVNGKTQISAAMEAVMRMNPEKGTALAYYLGQNPEESLRIAKLTLATNAEEWTNARIRAGMELAEISAKLPAPGAKKEPVKTSPTAASPPTTKKITTASKPPTVIHGGTAAPKFDPMNEDDAADYNAWLPAREREVRRK